MDFIEAKTPAELKLKMRQLYVQYYVKKINFDIVYDSSRNVYVAFYHPPRNLGGETL